MDEEYTQSDISKEVERLMEEEGFEFGEAVKQAMAQGYRDGGLTIQIQRLAEGGGVGSLMQPKRGLVNAPGGYAGEGDEVYTVEDIFERDTPLSEDLLGMSDGFTLSPITMLRRYMAEKELEKKQKELENNYQDGGRVGLFMGGDPLTGQAKMIYNSMSSYGYDDQTIADALKTQGLLPTSGTTPPGSTPPGSTPPGSTPPSGGGGDGDGGAGTTTTTEKLMSEKLRDPNFTFDRPTIADIANEVSSTTTDNRFSNSVGPVPSDTILDKLEITDRNRGMEDNEDFIDRGNPLNDSRIVSEEQGLVGGIPDRNRGQTISPQVQEVLSAVSRPTMADIAGPKAGTVDNSISIEDLSKPSNIGDFAITGAPDLANQTGILDAPPSISMAQDPNVEDPFGGKYTPSFQEKKAVEGILAGLVDKVQGYDIKDALKPENLTTALVGSQIGKFLDVPGSIASFALNTLKNQSDARKEKKAIAAEKAKTEARAAQARADKVEKKRKDDIAKRDATAAAKKAASEGRAYDYAGRKGDLSLPANKQGTHTSTISKEKAADNREAGRGQATNTKTTATKTTATKTKPTTTNQKSLREKLTGYKTQGEYDQASADRSLANRQSYMTERKAAGKSYSSKNLAEVNKALNERNSAKEAAKSKSTKSTNPNKRSGAGDGGGGGCFIKGTLITMFDGSTKPVEQVDLGNKVAVGGKVFAVGRFLNTELYDYKGIKVSGSHMVNEDGTWMRVRDTKHGKSLGDGQNTVYVFGSENRRILINDILFTDYFEIEDQEQLLKEEDKFFDNWKTFANNEDRKNVNTLNAS